MPPIVKDLLLSKKFVVALLTVAGSIAAYKGWSVDPMVVLPTIAPILVYLGAQGWADSGKEKAKIDQETTLKARAIEQETTLRAQLIQQDTAMKTQAQAEAHDAKFRQPQAGRVRVWLMIAGAAVGVGLGFGLVLGACDHPGQSTIRFGQCVLDDHVLSDVLDALAKPDYLKEVGKVALKDAAELVDCALRAAAAEPKPEPAPVPSVESVARSAATPSTLAQHARDVIAARKSSQ